MFSFGLTASPLWRSSLHHPHQLPQNSTSPTVLGDGISDVLEFIAFFVGEGPNLRPEDDLDVVAPEVEDGAPRVLAVDELEEPRVVSELRLHLLVEGSGEEVEVGEDEGVDAFVHRLGADGVVDADKDPKATLVSKAMIKTKK